MLEMESFINWRKDLEKNVKKYFETPQFDILYDIYKEEYGGELSKDEVKQQALKKLENFGKGEDI